MNNPESTVVTSEESTTTVEVVSSDESTVAAAVETAAVETAAVETAAVETAAASAPADSIDHGSEILALQLYLDLFLSHYKADPSAFSNLANSGAYSGLLATIAELQELLVIAAAPVAPAPVALETVTFGDFSDSEVAEAIADTEALLVHETEPVVTDEVAYSSGTDELSDVAEDQEEEAPAIEVTLLVNESVQAEVEVPTEVVVVETPEEVAIVETPEETAAVEAPVKSPLLFTFDAPVAQVNTVEVVEEEAPAPSSPLKLQA